MVASGHRAWVSSSWTIVYQAYTPTSRYTNGSQRPHSLGIFLMDDCLSIQHAQQQAATLMVASGHILAALTTDSVKPNLRQS